MNTKSILIWAGVIVITIGAIVGLYFLSGGGQGGGGSSSGLTLAAPVTAQDWRRNAPDGVKAVLVEYGDFECPACGTYEPMLEQLQTEFQGQLQFVFREFPLPQHVNAKSAAEAAEAAGRQGKFWEMHDKIYAEQNVWSNQSNSQALQTFKGYARALGLDAVKFSSDMDSPAVAAKIQNDILSGNSSGIQGTPSFFLNGKDAGYPQNYNDFKALIQKALQS